MVKCQEELKCKNGHAKKGWVITLENPLKKNRVTEKDLKTKILGIFGVNYESVDFYVTDSGNGFIKMTEANESAEITDLLGGKIIYVCAKGSAPSDGSFNDNIVNAINFPNQP